MGPPHSPQWHIPYGTLSKSERSASKFCANRLILAAHLSSRKDKSLFPRLKQLVSVSFIVVCVLMTWLSVLAGNGGLIRVLYIPSKLVAPACVPAGAIWILEWISIAKPRHRPGPSARSRLNAALSKYPPAEP